jgi:hypothetical protein
MPEWVQATFLDKASPVANPEHAHLADAHIGDLWAAVENKRKGKRVIGQCETGTSQGAMGTWAKARVEQQITDWFGSLPDFIITLDANYCAACGDAEFMALVEHELYHAAEDVDSFGAPKFNSQTGRPVFTIRGHDVEQFIGVFRRSRQMRPACAKWLIPPAGRQRLPELTSSMHAAPAIFASPR